MTSRKALGQSVSARLLSLAQTQKKPYDKLLTIFLIERVVVRLITDPVLATNLIFKGGYVGVRIYESPRFTTDLDAVLRGLSQDEAMARIKDRLIDPALDAAWFEFHAETDLKTQNPYGGRRLSYRAGLGEPPVNTKRVQVIDIDIGTGDPVTPAPVAAVTMAILGEGSLLWQVYPVETILAEKLHILITRGEDNSRAKDLFDVALLLPRADAQTLREALAATFAYRGDSLPPDVATLLEELDTAFLEKGWARAAGYIAGVQDFKTTLGVVVAALRGMGI